MLVCERLVCVWESSFAELVVPSNRLCLLTGFLRL